MKQYSTWLSVIAVIISFAGGFLVANALNKKELDILKSENAQLNKSSEESGNQNSQSDLTADEINQRIGEADKNADNFQYQKNLGIALYRYASAKNDAAILQSTAKILERAHKLNESDQDVAIALGDLNFDLGYSVHSNGNLDRAREIYQKVLKSNPQNSDVRTDLALTYFFNNPPDNKAAIAELNKSLQTKPDNQKSLQFLIQAYLRVENKAEAEIVREKLEKINPQTPSLNEIATQLTQDESKNLK